MSSVIHEISIAEREGELWSASRQYMLGEISLQELEDIEDHYNLGGNSVPANKSSKQNSFAGNITSSIAKLAASISRNPLFTFFGHVKDFFSRFTSNL